MIDVALIDKIQQLPPERISEVEDFVDFLSLRHFTGHVDGSNEISNGNLSLRDLGIGSAEAAYQTSGIVLVCR